VMGKGLSCRHALDLTVASQLVPSLRSG
jgi:hypothetical protein